ncbi:MAG: ABC transporter substrate-binding protein [Planctomycetota bacterium]
MPGRTLGGIIAILLLLLLVVELVRVQQANRLAERIEARDGFLAGEIATRLEQSPVLVRRLASELAKHSEGWRSGASGPTTGAPALAERPPPRPSIGRHGGTLVSPLYANPDSFNHVSASGLTSFWVTMHVLEPLFFRNAFTNAADPVLASSWEVSPDGMTTTVSLRRDVYWSDGEPLDAGDVLFTYEAIAHPSVQSYSKKIFEYDMGDGRIEHVRVERIDDHTVRFEQPLPYAAFYTRLYHPIVPEHVLRPMLERGEFSSAWGVGTDPSLIIGTGPFLIESYLPGEEVLLRRNPRHWRRDVLGQRLPYLDRLRLPIIEDLNAGRIAFLAGELDILPQHYMSGASYSEIATEAKGRGFEVIDLGPAWAYTYLVFNENTTLDPKTGEPRLSPYRLAWFRDSRFRRAVAHAIDRSAIVEECYDRLAFPIYSVYNQACGRFHNPHVTRYEHDLEQARSLLAQIGLTDRDQDGIREDADGHRVAFTITWWERVEAFKCVVRLLQERLRQVGIEAHSNLVGARDYSAKVFNTFAWEVLLGEDSGGAIDPAGQDPFWSSTAGYHIWFPAQESPSTPWEASVDRLFLEASAERDEARRLALLYEFQDIIAREAPLIPIVSEQSFAARRGNVENFMPSVLEPNAIYNAFEIWLSEE